MSNFKIPQAAPTMDEIDFYDLTAKSMYNWITRICKKEPTCVVCQKNGSMISTVGSIVQPSLDHAFGGIFIFTCPDHSQKEVINATRIALSPEELRSIKIDNLSLDKDLSTGTTGNENPNRK